MGKKAKSSGLGAFLTPKHVMLVPALGTVGRPAMVTVELPVAERLDMVKCAPKASCFDTRTFYCRHCKMLFSGPPEIINRDPLQDERWNILICPECRGANPFWVWFERVCEHEEKHYTLAVLDERQSEGLGLCNLKEELVPLDKCMECKDRVPLRVFPKEVQQ